MKRVFLIAAVLICVQADAVAHATEPPWTVLLVGGPENDSFQVKLSPDGRTYEINSAAPLEVGGSVCWHPGGDPLALLCDAPAIGSFEVRGEAGDDVFEADPSVRVPVVLLGGTGQDRLFSGAGDDKLFGGDGLDRLFGGGGNDSILGGPGADIVRGNRGNDELSGEGGQDSLTGGFGDDLLVGGLTRDFLYGGVGNDRLSGGEGRDSLFGGPGNDKLLDALTDHVSGGPGRDVAIPGGVVR